MKILLLAAALALLGTPALAAQSSDTAGAKAQIVSDAVDHYIVPGFDRLSAEADLMRTDMDALCVAPGQGELDTARQQFQSLVRAFSRIELVSFGPMATDNRGARLLFWPDAHGKTLRQVQKIINSKDTSAEDPKKLKQMSVAVQGLPALEYVLYGSGAKDMTKVDIAAHRCAYGKAISQRVSDTAGAIDDAWQAGGGTPDHLVHPKPAYTDYRNRTETIQALIDILAHGFETLHDTRLLPVFGTNAKTDKPKAALWWRSDMTLPALRANIERLSQFVAVAGFERAVPSDQRWILGSLNFELRNATRTLEALGTTSIADALSNKDKRDKLRYLAVTLKSLTKLTGADLANALGVSVGLSALDGD